MHYFDNLYLQPTQEYWQGRKDIPAHSAFFQIVQLLNLKQPIQISHSIKNFALLGFQCDEGVRRNFGKVGAALGPSTLRHALAKFPVHRNDFIFYDAGDIICLDNDLETAQAMLGEAVALLLQSGFIPIVIGGGHEIAWGHYQGIRKFIKHKNLGIINFDAHLDMRNLSADGKGNSGTPFLQMALDCQKNNDHFDYHCIGVQKSGNIQQLFDNAKKYKAKITFADEIHDNNIEKFEHDLNQILNQNEWIYLTICLDVFSSAIAPAVSSPQPLGVFAQQIMPYIAKIIQSKKVISFDIAEFCPKFDHNHMTEKLVASLVYEYIHFYHH